MPRVAVRCLPVLLLATVTILATQVPASRPPFQLLSTRTAAALPDQWWLGAADAPRAWAMTRGAGATVCDVDSGADLVHPDIQPAIVGSVNLIDPTQTAQDSGPDAGHGTHTSGIMIGRGTQITGIAPEASLLVVKVFANGGAGTPTVVAGIRWCVDHGANVVNMSFGGGPAPAMTGAVQYGCDHGVAFAAAAGNEDWPYPPTAHSVVSPADIASPCLVAVGASDRHGHFAVWSDWKTNKRELTAPGAGVVSDWPGGGTRVASGTSMAAPVASAALALEMSEGATASQAVADLLTTARRDTRYQPHTRFGAGEIDVAHAVRLVRMQHQQERTTR